MATTEVESNVALERAQFMGRQIQKEDGLPMLSQSLNRMLRDSAQPFVSVRE